MQQVPVSRTERHRIRSLVASLPLISPLTDGQPVRNQLETQARSIVNDDHYIAWTMVLIGSHRWQRRVSAVPIPQRLLLLPHCMRNASQCPAGYDSEGLHCQTCGACELARLKTTAQTLGYRVLIAEGSPVVMQWILSGKVNAILGVGCLRSLEKAFEKLQLAGIPAQAVPLHHSTCKDSTTDIDWVLEMIQTPYTPADPIDAPPTYIHLLREAGRLFAGNLPAFNMTERSNTDSSNDSPARQTESLAFDFVSRGGKFYRPFITLAVYDSLTGSNCTSHEGEKYAAQLPDWVKNAARTIEIFHKASLVHDDIQDGDLYRYGQPTLHQTHGIATAINVGDYLLGYGYRLIANLREEMSRQDLAGPIVAEMLSVLSSAHCRLCVGQGTELAWKAKGEIPTAEDVLRFYVGKTSPAFEAALNIGVLAAVASGAVDQTFYADVQKQLQTFSKHLGAVFQIKNDLEDWFPDSTNKKIAGTDIASMRPTLLHAWFPITCPSERSVSDWHTDFERLGLFDKARHLASRYSRKARDTAFAVEHSQLRALLLHFTEALGMG